MKGNREVMELDLPRGKSNTTTAKGEVKAALVGALSDMTVKQGFKIAVVEPLLEELRPRRWQAALQSAASLQ